MSNTTMVREILMDAPGQVDRNSERGVVGRNGLMFRSDSCDRIEVGLGVPHHDLFHVIGNY